MMMCLQANGIDCDEDEVNRVMGAKPMQGASWEDAAACAQHYGMRVHLVIPATVGQLKEWTDQGTPVMIAWNPEDRDWSHASVVFDVAETPEGMNVYVADPNIPNPSKVVRVVSEDDFYSKWAEKWPKYLVRRPAMAIEREITPQGRQVVASRPGPHWNPWPTEAETIEDTIRHLTRYLEDEDLFYKVYDAADDYTLDHVGRLVHALKRQDRQRAKREAEWLSNSAAAAIVSNTIWDFIHTGRGVMAKKKRRKNKPKSMKTRMKTKKDDESGQRNPYVPAMRQRGGQGAHGTKSRRTERRKQKQKGYDREAALDTLFNVYVRDRIDIDTVLDILNADPPRTASNKADPPYEGNPDGKPIYPNKVEHGYDQPLAGGTDVMKRLQDRLLIEQGKQPREPNPRLASNADWQNLIEHPRASPVEPGVPGLVPPQRLLGQADPEAAGTFWWCDQAHAEAWRNKYHHDRFLMTPNGGGPFILVPPHEVGDWGAKDYQVVSQPQNPRLAGE
jgi:hypothetical protein